MSEYVKLTLAAAALAVSDAGVAGDMEFAAAARRFSGRPTPARGTASITINRSSRTGCSRRIRCCLLKACPMPRPAHLSMTLSLKGSCQTILGTRTAGLDAMRLAQLRIATGQWDRAIVSAAEEFTPLASQAYAACGGSATNQCEFPIGCGAVTMVLESESSFASRGGRSRGQHHGRLPADGCDPITPSSGYRRLHSSRIAGVESVVGSAQPNQDWLHRLEQCGNRTCRSDFQRLRARSISGVVQRRSVRLDRVDASAPNDHIVDRVVHGIQRHGCRGHSDERPRFVTPPPLPVLRERRWCERDFELHKSFDG